MDKNTLDKMLQMMASENDSDAIMGLRGLQGLLRVEGIDLGKVIAAALSNPAFKAAPAEAPAATEPAKEQKVVPAAVSISGMPQCYSLKPGTVEIIPPGQDKGEAVILPGVSAAHSDEIALHLKDALVAAAINKSRFKLKLLDVKNGKGEITETILQAEYERAGMAPVKVWANIRGETAALATVLRRAVAASIPDLVAA